MELKDFITNTLTQIAEGVKNSQESFKKLGGTVNPSGLRQISGDIPFGKDTPIQGDAHLLCNVQFEVSLTSDNASNASGGIGVLFGSLSIGGKAGSENKEISLNKVKFNIPVTLPSQRV